MRFSIFEYSQEKLVSLGLDVTDALILNWFANFFCGKMEKQIFKDESGNARIFGWVRTSKIIEDLPVIGIASEKGIRRRFDAFVEKGILDRQTVQTQNGKKSYYRTTAVYDSLINTAVSQGNENRLAENQEQKNESENPQGTKTAHAENQDGKTDEKNPQRNCDGLAQRNENRLAQRNCDGLALNDSLISDMVIKDTPSSRDEQKNVQGCTDSEDKAEEDFSGPVKETVCRLFSVPSFPFSADFLSQLTETCKSMHMQRGTIQEYLSWYHQECVRKKPNDLLSYFYKTAATPYNIVRFLEHEKKETARQAQAEENNVACPVCKTRHVFYEVCPCCGLTNYDNQAEIRDCKAIFELPEREKASYHKALEELSSRYGTNLAVYNKKKRELFEKYTS